MRSLFFVFLLCSQLLFATKEELIDVEDENTTNNFLQVHTYVAAIKSINNELKGSIWLTRYSNFVTYQKLIKELDSVDEELKILNKSKDKDLAKQKATLTKKQETLEKQLELLKEFKRSPFGELVKPPEVKQAPKISNPLAIIAGFSYIKKLQTDKTSYHKRIEGLETLISKLNAKEELLKLLKQYQNDPNLDKELDVVRRELNEFSAARDISKTTLAVYEKSVDEAVIGATESITSQMKRAFNIGLFILIVIILSIMFKFFAKKYIKDNERFYMANKIINFINVTLIILILLFAYIENVTYLVTVVGFASAGVAIAMKDMFMSVLGWMVIVFGGSFHVGDRVKVRKDGLSYVGDIIDISLLRMTILEDITLTSYMENRRSGRVVFIPNNYIFTTLISNYTHVTMKTVWDGIDVTITFDSNYKKALYVIKNITKKYSKGYTDIARKQLNMLRHQYSLKNTNVEPRIYSFLEPHGLTISTWYMTNSYAALALRSTLSAEIIDAINKEDDITIAFPTQTLHVKTNQSKNIPIDINKDVLF